jgi:XRE family transcriptional regulator, master regulator for biofilm formation
MVGKKIKKWRIKRRYTINQLSSAAGISKSYLSNIERGIQQNPSLNILSKIADCLDITVEDLLDSSQQNNDLEPDWMNFLHEIKELGVSKEEFSYILDFIKINRKHFDDKK